MAAKLPSKGHNFLYFKFFLKYANTFIPTDLDVIVSFRNTLQFADLTLFGMTMWFNSQMVILSSSFPSSLGHWDGSVGHLSPAPLPHPTQVSVYMVLINR